MSLVTSSLLSPKKGEKIYFLIHLTKHEGVLKVNEGVIVYILEC